MTLKNTLNYRQSWLGVAMLWIILFHLPFNFGSFSFFKNIGYGGVDICFFASGIGCYYSLCTDSDVVNFMKRRLKRLMPTYIIFIAGWLLYKYVLGELGFQMALGNILAIQNFTGHGQDFNWYISAVFLFYILAPYFKTIIDRSTRIGKIMFLIFLFVISIPFWNSNTYIITVTRLPIFYIGMLYGNECKKDAQVSKTHICAMIISFAIGLILLRISRVYIPGCLWTHGLYWYPFIFLTPPLCVAMSYIFRFMTKVKLTNKIVSVLELCGEYSFEIYLMHIMIISAINIIINKFNLFEISCWIWCGGAVALVLGCIILRKLTVSIKKLCK